MSKMPLDETSQRSSGSFKGSTRLHRSHTLDTQKSNPRLEKQQQRPLTQSLSELIICAICLEQLRRPTMLPCQHTFCLHCLHNCVKSNSLLITCPTCRLEVLIPPEGVASLPTNILLQAFLESIKPETTSTTSTSAKANLTAAAVAARKSEFQCSNSKCLSGAVPNLSCCPHCQQVFCDKCQSVHTSELKAQWREAIGYVRAEDQRLSLLREESKIRGERLGENIQATIAMHVQQLLEKQEVLLGELEAWNKAEETRYSHVQQLCQDVLASSVKETRPKVELLMRTATVLQQARLCGSTRLTFDDEELTLSRESTEAADGTGDRASSLMIAAAAPAPAPSATVAVVEASASPVVLRRNRRVTFIGNEGLSPTFESVPEERKSLNHPPPGQTQTSSSVVDEADSRSLFYRSKSNNPRQRVSSGLIQRPAGVAVSPWTGEIYVAGTDSHRVYIIDKNGKIVRSMGSPAANSNQSASHANDNGGGTFLCPFGIAFSTINEEIYVTDKWLNCLQVFNKEGAYVRQIGSKGTSPGHFRSPEGIAVDIKGYIYVCDTCNDRVQILDRSGAYVRELGLASQMTLPGGKVYQKREFNEPTGVTVSPDGSRIAVCDFGNCRIKVFNTSGERLVVFGSRGGQRSQFVQPECLVMDDKGFILVGDSGNGRIQIFRSNGNFVRTIGSKGPAAGQFNWISGLALSKDNEIIASDFKNHCIQIF